MTDTEEEKLCLHCSLIETIHSYYSTKGEKHGDDFVMDMQEVLNSLCEVVAEMIASHPDRREREHLSKLFARGLRESIPVIRARGEGRYPKPMRLS